MHIFLSCVNIAFQWKLLANANIWKDAATQMFFTLSLGFGALVAFASYMPMHNQVMRDAYTVVFVNCGTSIFAGIVVFSILGYREKVTGIPVTEVFMHFIWRCSVWLIFDFLREGSKNSLHHSIKRVPINSLQEHFHLHMHCHPENFIYNS